MWGRPSSLFHGAEARSPPRPLSPIVSVGAQPKRSSALSLLLGLALVVAVGGVAFAVGR